MKNIIFKKYLLILILVLAFLLRFIGLKSYPAFNADEAALGYNAYSLIKTGLDEHGNKFPIHFQSFNDYKPGGYVYMILPFVFSFGLNELSVRVPGAFLGVLSVLLIYLLVKKLFKDERLSLMSSLFLAISPWHIHFSRGGWEVNAATFFILLAVLMFLEFVDKKDQKKLLLSLLSFGVSMYTYHSARLIAPLLGIGLLIIYWKELSIFKRFKSYLLPTIVFFAFMFPLVLDFTRGAVASRAAGVGLFADPGPLSRIEEQRREHLNFASPTAKLLHNKLVNYGLAFLENWSEHYHGLFLFLSGDDIQRNKVPETGQMYLYDLPLILIGLWLMLRKMDKSKLFTLYWLIIAPFAAALTFQSPHALRAQNMVIPLVIVGAFGLNETIRYASSLKNKNLFKAVTIFIFLIITWQFVRYLHMYWVHMSKEYPYSSQYGVKELVEYVSSVEGKYKNIVITDRYDQPYILYLFYQKYDPAKFQKEHSLTPKDGFGFSTVRSFDKFRFYSIKFEEMRTEYPNSLIIGTPNEIPDEANIIKRIYGTNGFEYFDVVAN